MSESIKKIADLNHVMVEVKVSAISGEKDLFQANALLNQYDPEKFIPSGGPITLKGINVSALGGSYDEAYANVLDRAVELMGL